MHLQEKPPEELSSRTWRMLLDVLNGGLGVENFAGEIITFNAPVSDVEVAVPHKLFRVPRHFLVIGLDKGGVVYNSATPWTNKFVYLKCSVPNTNITVLVL